MMKQFFFIFQKRKSKLDVKSIFKKTLGSHHLRP